MAEKNAQPSPPPPPEEMLRQKLGLDKIANISYVTIDDLKQLVGALTLKNKKQNRELHSLDFENERSRKTAIDILAKVDDGKIKNFQTLGEQHRKTLKDIRPIVTSFVELYKEEQWGKIKEGVGNIKEYLKDKTPLADYIRWTLKQPGMSPIGEQLRARFYTYVVYHYQQLSETEQQQVLDNIKTVLPPQESAPKLAEPKPAAPALPEVPASATSKSQLDELRKEYEAQLEALKKENKNLATKNQQLLQQISSQQESLGETRAELAQTHELVASQAERIGALSQELAKLRKELEYEIVRGAGQKRHLQIKGEEVTSLTQKITQLTGQLETSREDYHAQLKRATELQQLVERSEGEIKLLKRNLGRLQEKNLTLSNAVLQQKQEIAQLQERAQERDRAIVHLQREQLKQEVNIFIKQMRDLKHEPTTEELKKGTISFLRAVHEDKAEVKKDDWRIKVLTTLLGYKQDVGKEGTPLMRNTIQKIQNMDAKKLEHKLEKFATQLIEIRELSKTAGITPESALKVIKGPNSNQEPEESPPSPAMNP